MTQETISAHSWRPRRFMVIVGHPDDADFGPAGTASAWIDAGSQGWLVCCTSGDAGARTRRRTHWGWLRRARRSSVGRLKSSATKA